MSKSDDKKDAKNADQKAPGTKPLKRNRKRQASRPPTINVEAVRVEAETGKEKSVKKNQKAKDKVTPEVKEQSKVSGSSKSGFDAAKPKSGKSAIKGGSGEFGYRALALSAATGAVASIVLLTVIFGLKSFSSDRKDVEQNIADLSGKINSLNTSVDNSRASQLTNTNTIKALNLQIESLTTRLQEGQFGKNADRIKTLEEALAKLKKPEINAAELKGLSDRVGVLAREIKAAKSAAEKSIRRATLVEKAIKEAVKTNEGLTNGTQGLSVAQTLRLTDMEAQVKRLSENLDRLNSQAAPNPRLPEFEKIVSGLQEGISSVESGIRMLDGRVAKTNKTMTTSNAATLKQEQRISALEKVDRSTDIGRLTALSFALENLVRKIESGDVFKRELDIVTAAIPQSSPLEKLKKQASSGVSSIAQLQRRFILVLPTILTTEDAPAPTGVMGMFVASAKSLVRIRRVGEIEGEDREAIIARLEVRVKAGDLKAALVEAKKLKSTSAQAVKVWVEAVENRLETIELIKNIRNDVISNLGSGNARSGTKE
jgi:hypothetical protein